MIFKKAKVMERRDLKLNQWHEVHFGVVVNSNEWGAQIYDPNSQFNNGISSEMLAHCEWFPFNSPCQRVELI